LRHPVTKAHSIFPGIKGRRKQGQVTKIKSGEGGKWGRVNHGGDVGRKCTLKKLTKGGGRDGRKKNSDDRSGAVRKVFVA